MMGMVDVGRLPALLLCKEGKVVHHLDGLDRSFTTKASRTSLASTSSSTSRGHALWQGWQRGDDREAARAAVSRAE